MEVEENKGCCYSGMGLWSKEGTGKVRRKSWPAQRGILIEECPSAERASLGYPHPRWWQMESAGDRVATAQMLQRRHSWRTSAKSIPNWKFFIADTLDASTIFSFPQKELCFYSSGKPEWGPQVGQITSTLSHRMRGFEVDFELLSQP